MAGVEFLGLYDCIFLCFSSVLEMLIFKSTISLVSFLISELDYTGTCSNSYRADNSYTVSYIYYIDHWSIWGYSWLYEDTVVRLNLFQTSSSTSSAKIHPSP